ncbi:MAG: diacylglycerol kinase family protein [Bacteroidetes bacterium]|jgi:diacylglycerol kinase|nr:diacylglycerol kinase family protein [Bacteroidota bacterium]
MKSFLGSLSYAINGIRLLFYTQKNARYHLMMAFSVCGLGWFFRISVLEWIIVCACIGAVIFAESVNTTIEYLVNFISPDYHIKAGQIKDLAAGSVLILSITTGVIGLIIFIPKVMKYLHVNIN